MPSERGGASSPPLAPPSGTASAAAGGEVGSPDRPAPAARSFLYAPGDRPERFAKACASGADAVILDLEDGVAPAAKDLARANVAERLDLVDDGPDLWVRVNPDERIADDLAAIIGRPGLHGILVPKATFDSVSMVLDAGAPRVAPLIESARGLVDLERLASLPRVSHLALGEADLVADLGVEPGPRGDELLPLRMQVVVASAAAGIAAPAAPVSTAFRALDAFRTSTVELRRIGFGARSCIHPAQVAIVNEVMAPSEADVARARDLVARFEAAEGGVCLDPDGKMVDEAVVRSARRLLARLR
jgi:citrate lyase subunit beta/citryl-CoA lyase